MYDDFATPPGQNFYCAYGPIITPCCGFSLAGHRYLFSRELHGAGPFTPHACDQLLAPEKTNDYKER